MSRELHEFRALIAEGCPDVPRPDAALVGRITGPRRIGALGRERYLVFTLRARTNGVGLVASAHCTAGVADAPFPVFPYDLPQWDVDRRDYMMAEPLKVDGAGNIVLTDWPGIGYELAEEMLAKTRTG
jgi:L-alanine-DL-glutamate epimerase-like enolase superfamily enzyme